jgi:hypothetical protein
LWRTEIASAHLRPRPRRDGIVLVAQSFEWLSERGHLVLPPAAKSAAEALERIYVALGGDLATLGTARRNRLRGDFVHEVRAKAVAVSSCAGPMPRCWMGYRRSTVMAMSVPGAGDRGVHVGR